MTRMFKISSGKAGLAPGTMVHIGERKASEVVISAFSYSDDDLKEETLASADACQAIKDSPLKKWINIEGLHDTPVIEKAGGIFGLHPLVLEDIVNTGQRPKVEDYEEYLYAVMKMISIHGSGNEIDVEQVSFVLGRDFLLTFQEIPGDVFDPVRERLRKSKFKIRKLGPDYLFYTLLDSVVDNYFTVMEHFSERITALEEALAVRPSPRLLREIYVLKRSIIFLRRSISPVRDVASELMRSESPLIEDKTKIYFRDLYDHSLRVTEMIDTFRDMLAGLMDMYMSGMSNRMNEVMKVLTVFASIFIPLTFVVGIYGMNFEYMPELKWKYGYLGIWIVMLGVAITMLIYFKRKRWILSK